MKPCQTFERLYSANSSAVMSVVSVFVCVTIINASICSLILLTFLIQFDTLQIDTHDAAFVSKSKQLTNILTRLYLRS